MVWCGHLDHTSFVHADFTQGLDGLWAVHDQGDAKSIQIFLVVKAFYFWGTGKFAGDLETIAVGYGVVARDLYE